MPKNGIASTSIAIPPPDERRARLESRYPAWRPMTLSQAFDRTAAEFPDRPFVITDHKTWTYADIKAWSRRLAAGMLATGIKPGDHVAVLLANYPEFVAVKFAIARVGAVAVPINFLLRRQELAYVLQQSDTVLLITMDRFRDRDYLADLAALMPSWESNGGGLAFPKLRGVRVFSTSREELGVPRLEDLEKLGVGAAPDGLQRRETQGDPTFRSDVIYTSGTTGQPKGVMLTHDMVLRVAYASAYWRAFEDGRRFIFALPMYHVFGYIECMIASTFVGGAVIPHLQFEPEKLLEAAERHRASEIDCVPVMTAKLLEVARTRGFDKSHVISVFNSGGINPPAIWADIRNVLGGREIATGYGMTETSATTICTRPEDPDDCFLNTNGGLKLAGVAGDPAFKGMLAWYKTIDPHTGADLPVGTRGELVVRGPIVTRGYYNKPEETAAAFTKDGWLRTGDVGTIDAQGNLVLLGRIKETYRCGGEMVMPREIEDLLNEHPLVSQALVVGVPDGKMGEVGCVCVVPKGERRPDPKELIDLCAEHLARFKVPKHVIFVSTEDIPVTPTGRPQKFRLAELARQRLGVG